MFRFLTQVEYNNLNAQARAKYDEALDAYVTEFLTAHPNGFEATLRITDMTLTDIPGKDGKENTFGMSFVTDNDIVNTNLPGGRISRPVTNGHILAKNAGFGSWPHMAMSIRPLADKGSFKVRFNVHVKGETYGTGLKTGTYKHTSLAQETFEYIPSTAVSARYAKLTEAAASKGFADMLYAGSSTRQAAEPVVTETDSPDTDI